MEMIFMLIIIDGYNLIRQSVDLKRHERKSLEAGRNALLARLAEYGKIKNHQITVVFDGIQSGWAEEGRDRAGKINIIYSRHGERADDVIKRLAAHSSEEIIVVSSDREISSYVTRLGRTSLSSPEFETIMDKTITADFSPLPEMREDEDEQSRPVSKKGPSRKLPRARRKAQSKINKL